MDYAKEEEKKIEKELGTWLYWRMRLFPFGAYLAFLIISLDWINLGSNSLARGNSLARDSFNFIRFLPNNGNIILITFWALIIFLILGGIPIYFDRIKKPRLLCFIFILTFFSLPLLRYYLCLANSCKLLPTINVTFLNALAVSLGTLIGTETTIFFRNKIHKK